MNMNAHNLSRKKHKHAYTKGQRKADYRCSKIRTQNKEVKGKQKIVSMMRSKSSRKKMVKIKKKILK